MVELSNFAPVSSSQRWTAIAVQSWREARPVVQTIFQLRFMAGVVLSGGFAADAGLGAVGLTVGSALVWLCATASVYILNGATDVVEDRANGSRRPVAAGRLSPTKARQTAITLGIVALLGAAAQSVLLLLLITAVLALGVAYSEPPLALKRWTGGVAFVAFLGGLLTYAAGAVVGGKPNAGTLVFAGLLSAWIAMVGALTKDLPDVFGDTVAGRRTIAVVYGVGVATRLAATAAAGIGVTALVLSHLFAPQLQLQCWLLAAGGVLVARFALVVDRAQPRTLGRPYQAFMTTQYVVHLSLPFSLVLNPSWL
jgi:4-hydroxybenzoate polyprenyltransferase